MPTPLNGPVLKPDALAFLSAIHGRPCCFLRDDPAPLLAPLFRAAASAPDPRAAGGALLADMPEGYTPAGAPAGIAVFRIYGPIVPRESYLTRYFGLTALDSFRAKLKAVAADPGVAAILLDVDSPGGMAEGLQETAALLRAVRAEKPILAYANATCASAAYWLAAQANRLIVTPDADAIGSVGSVILQVDSTEFWKQMGVTWNIIRAPERKYEGSELEPLGAVARQALQDVVNATTAQFEADVAKGRGLSVTKVRQDFGRGAVLMAQPAVAVGMADALGTFEDAVTGALKLGKKGARRAELPTDSITSLLSENGLVGAAVPPAPVPLNGLVGAAVPPAPEFERLRLLSAAHAGR